MKTARLSVLLTGLLSIVFTSQSTVNAQLTQLSIAPPPIPTEMREKLRKLAPMLSEEIRSNPKESGPYVARAGLWCRLGEYKLAILDARQAIRLDARSSRAHSWLGSALAMSGKPKPAVAEFEKALELGADKSTTYKMLAQCRAELGEYKRALEDVAASIATAPDVPDWKKHRAMLYMIRGFLHFAKGDTKKAAADFDQIVRILPDNAGSYKMRGLFYLMEDDCAKALAEFEQALRLDDPGNPRYGKLTSLLNAEGLPVEDGKICNAARHLCDKTDWDNWLALAIYSDWLFQAHRYDEANKRLSMAIERAPEDMKEQLRKRHQEQQRHSPFRPPRHR